jgi:DNA polymerase III alpha subunit
VGRPFVLRLLAEREKGGPFGDLQDFLRRVDPGHLELRILVRSGALDGLAPDLVRPQMLCSALRRGGSGELFPRPLPPLADYPPELKALDELRTLGLMVSRHPVTLFRAPARTLAGRLGFPPLVGSAAIPAHRGREVSLVGLVASGKEALTRNGRSMVFITLEDEEDLFETVLFPGVFARHRRAVQGGGLLLVCGRVEGEPGACSLTLRRISRLSGV